MSEVVMPRLSDSMEEGTILTWLKQVGDEVAVGDELVEIETDKANMAYESDVAGTLTEILARRGRRCRSGRRSRVIGENGARYSARDRALGPRVLSPMPGSPCRESPRNRRHPRRAAGRSRRLEPLRRHEPQASEGDGERVKASPLARRLARARASSSRPSRVRPRGTDRQAGRRGAESAGALSVGDAVSGPFKLPARLVGPCRGRTRRSCAGPSTETAKGEIQTQELNKLQQTIARRMAESKATAPHFYLTIEIDMGKAVEARAALKAAAQGGRGGAFLQRHGRQGLRDRPAGVPESQRRLPRRALRALLAGQRRRRRRRRGSAGRADGLRRRQEGPAADRRRHPRRRRQSPRRLGHAAGALGRHLHRLQPRDVRDRRRSTR